MLSTVHGLNAYALSRNLPLKVWCFELLLPLSTNPGNYAALLSQEVFCIENDTQNFLSGIFCIGSGNLFSTDEIFYTSGSVRTKGVYQL